MEALRQECATLLRGNAFFYGFSVSYTLSTSSEKNDRIKAELAEAKIRGVPKLNPDKVDVSGFTYDTEHINDERLHGVTRADAEKFIQEADISLTRWNGQFINYYSPNGATYVDVKNRNIRTAFKKEQFDEPTLKIREVAERYGNKKT